MRIRISSCEVPLFQIRLPLYWGTFFLDPESNFPYDGQTEIRFHIRVPFNEGKQVKEYIALVCLFDPIRLPLCRVISLYSLADRQGIRSQADSPVYDWLCLTGVPGGNGSVLTQGLELGKFPRFLGCRNIRRHFLFYWPLGRF